MEDEMEYIHGLHNNNSTVIQKIYDECFSLIRTLIIRNNGDEDDARDIFQEGLILVLKKSKKSDFELKSKFSVFLYGICRFLWMNKLRKKSGNEVTITDTMTYIDDFSIENFLHQEAQITLYKEKFKELGASCQQLLQLFFNKTPYKEIVDIMDNYSSVNSAKKQKHSCVQQLIKKIRADKRYQELKK